MRATRRCTKRASAARAKATIATSRRAGRIHQHAKAWDGRDRRGGPGQTDEHRKQRCGGGPQSRGEQQTEQAEQRSAGRFGEVRPGRPGRHLPAQDRLDRLGLDPHRGRRRRGGGDAQAAELRGAAADQHDPSGKRGPCRGIVDQPCRRESCGAAGNPAEAQHCIAAKRQQRGRRRSACRLGSISSAPAPCASRTVSTARPGRTDAACQHQQRHPADRAIRIGGRDQGAEALRGVGEHRDRADDAVGPPQARQRKRGARTGSALRAGPGRNSRCPARTQAPTGRRQRLRQRSIAVRREPIRSGEQDVERRARRAARRPRRKPARPCGGAAMATARSGQAPRGRYRR